MARLKNGLLGGFSGKVGNVVGSSCRGVEYIKSVPSKMTNPRSKGQTRQRSSFIVIQSFLRTFTPVIRIGFQEFAVDGKSAFNAAMSYNMINGIKAGVDGIVIDYKNILISKGPLYCSSTIKAGVFNYELKFEWDSENKYNANPHDQVMVLAYNTAKAESVYDINAGKRRDASTFIELPESWSGDVIETYVAFKNMVSTMVSNSLYTGGFTV